MVGETLEEVKLDWHGLNGDGPRIGPEGDLRLAFRKIGDRGGFPWLTASNLPELLQFTPVRAVLSGGLETATGPKMRAVKRTYQAAACT